MSERPTNPAFAEAITQTVEWQKAQNKRLVVAVTVLALAVAVLVPLTAILLFAQPKPVYFAATPNLRVVRLTPMDQPILTDAALLNWAAKVVSETLSLDFRHWQRQVADAAKYYTQKGKKNLLAALQKSGNVRMVEKKRLFVTVVNEKAPVIAAGPGVLNGVLTWKIQVPIVVSYENSEGVVNTQHLMAELLVQRADEREYPYGVAVAQILLTPVK